MTVEHVTVGALAGFIVWNAEHGWEDHARARCILTRVTLPRRFSGRRDRQIVDYEDVANRTGCKIALKGN